MARNSNDLVKEGARKALDNLKMEIAEELGLHDYTHLDKGNLSSRQNGYVGGYMTRKLVKYAEQAMANQNSTFANVESGAAQRVEGGPSTQIPSNAIQQ